MPVLLDERKEAFAQLRAKGWKLAPAYRECFDTDALPSSIWSMASLLNIEVSQRVTELQGNAAQSADNDPTIITRLELLRDLTEAWRMPIEAIDETSQFAQEIKITTDTQGNEYKTIKSIPKAAVSQQIQGIMGWTTQQPQSLSLHLHNHEAARTNSLEDAAKTLALEFAAASTVIDLEPIPVEQPKPKKQRK